MRFNFIHAERANYPVRVMCRVLRVSTSGYYAQMKRAPSKRQCEDGKLKLRIQAIHAHSRGTYGRERVRRQLDGENVEVGKQRVARLMREMGLQGLPSKRFRRTTDSKHDRPVAPNVLGRNFEAERPNQFWVTDITFIRTWEGWLYLAEEAPCFFHGFRDASFWTRRERLSTIGTTDDVGYPWNGPLC